MGTEKGLINSTEGELVNKNEITYVEFGYARVSTAKQKLETK